MIAYIKQTKRSEVLHILLLLKTLLINLKIGIV